MTVLMRPKPLDGFKVREFKMLIDGKWTAGAEGKTIERASPGHGAVVSRYEAATVVDANRAIASARKAFDEGHWPRMTGAERRSLEMEHQASARLVQLRAEEDYEYFNTEFHSRLYRGAHNTHIHDLTVMTRSRLAPFRRAQFMLPGRLAKSWQEHDLIVTAIMRGDGAAAGKAARDHVSIVSEASAVFAAADPAPPALSQSARR